MSENNQEALDAVEAKAKRKMEKAEKEETNTFEEVAEALTPTEETIDALERIPKVHFNGTTKKQQYIILGVTALVSALTSGGIVYYFVKKSLKLKYEKIAEHEIAEAKTYYTRLHKKGEYSDPESVLEEAKKKDPNLVVDEEYVKQAGAYSPSPSPRKPVAKESDLGSPEVEVVKDPVKVFKDARSANSYFDYDQEVPKRSEAYPYVITYDEFIGAEKDYEQTTLTYYEGDDVLTDSKDQPIEETDVTVGNENLFKFGFGSNDSNTIYIRNERVEMEFEVIRSTGKYAREVLGFIEHSEHRGHPRKFRGDDE